MYFMTIIKVCISLQKYAAAVLNTHTIASVQRIRFGFLCIRITRDTIPDSVVKSR